MKNKGYVCESGGKRLPNGRYINEDGLMTFSTRQDSEIYNFVILMDGATGLGESYEIEEGITSAEWYVKHIMNIMKEMLLENPTRKLEDVVENSILKIIEKIDGYEIENNIRLEEYQKPSAGLALLRANESQTEIYLIGDTQGLIVDKTDNVCVIDSPSQKALQALDGSVIARMVEIANEGKCNVIDTRTDEEIEKMLKVNREKKNTGVKDGYWVCGTTKGTSEHGTLVELNNSEITGVILATDGFDYSVLGLDEQELYKEIKKQGVEKIARLIRKKQNEDPMCNKYPRFKKSDDLTVIYCEH